MWNNPKKKKMNTDDIAASFGLRVTNASTDNNLIEVLSINNPDGTIRWFWPASSRRPLFLKFYHTRGFKAKVFSFLIRVIFILRLQRLVFNKLSFQASGSHSLSGITPTHNDWAVFTGTVGPNRKIIMYRIGKNTGTFVKIPLGSKSEGLLENEFSTLEWLRLSSLSSFTFPSVSKDNSKAISLADIALGGERQDKFSECHSNVIREIIKKTGRSRTVETLPIWIETLQRFTEIKKQKDIRIPSGMLRKLEDLIAQTPNNQVIDVCMSHGDFTPWNMYCQQDGSLALYDWELSRMDMPYGYDAFHFVIQNSILVRRASWKQIQSELQKLLFSSTSLMGSLTSSEQQLYLRFYLIINVVYYLSIYKEQQVWHQQVEWLIDTWNEALSCSRYQNKNCRQLVSMDLIDFLSRLKYAALKYHNGLPETLSEYSDIDICISKEDYRKVSAFLATHPLVKRREVREKSFMSSELLICSDGSILGVDFIWQLKRKHQEIMNVKHLLNNTCETVYGVKVANDLDNSRFIGLFYALNNAPVPAKYHSFRDTLLESEAPIDNLLGEYFDEPEISRDAIANYINNQNSNSGIQGIINRFAYWVDSAREISGSYGMVITFSGVDGAGKSTVIENLKLRIEKQLRKRVVVLRHRPSLLPILSAWTKGKVVAEQDAASRLPRQGKNKNTISSILRFAYYYVDYLIGQFYILVKYVLRGQVVLYDRYYFDFINDSRRSNIALPSSITRLGYSLIIEPDLNFFLYARPEVILSRKQELDEITILNLTGKYLSLFNRLNLKSKTQRYIPIENNELTLTLNTIIGKMI